MPKSLKKALVISWKYPNEKNPTYTFVDELVKEFVNAGLETFVISPSSVTDCFLRKTPMNPSQENRSTRIGNSYSVYSPRYVSLSTTFLGFNTAMLTYRLFRSAVLREIEERRLSADALYGHFLYPSGMCVADLGERLGIPAFLAYGECYPELYKKIDRTIIREKLLKIKGVIAVSTKNKAELLEEGLLDEEHKISVFPNAVDIRKFFKTDKIAVRRELGIEENAFVIAFVGHFIERKGVELLSNVLNELEGVYSIFIGSGPKEPNCKNTLFKGQVPHEEVHKYLNAADVFVLPTIAEGCSNAIIEAMACGLPIVSSNLPFNDDILSEENSFRINVVDKEELKQSIVLLRDNQRLREKMSEASLKQASSFRIEERAQAIIRFMESRA